MFAGRLSEARRDRWGVEARQDVYRIETVIGLVVTLAIVALLRPDAEPVPVLRARKAQVISAPSGWARISPTSAPFRRRITSWPLTSVASMPAP